MFRDKVLGDPALLSRLAGVGARTPFVDIANQYAADHTGKDDRFQQRLDYWKDVFKDTVFSNINRAVVAAEYHRLYQDPALMPRRKGQPRPSEKKRTRATANRYLSTLSQVFAHALDMGLIDSNPCKDIKRGGESSRFGRSLTDEERTALLETCKVSEWDRLYLLVTMALSTGARLGNHPQLLQQFVELARRARVSERFK